MLTIYQTLLNAGIPVENHYSDLYCPVTRVSSIIIREYEAYATTFTSEGQLWYDIPFAFDPYWAGLEYE